jgi:hypothetical protein
MIIMAERDERIVSKKCITVDNSIISTSSSGSSGNGGRRRRKRRTIGSLVFSSVGFCCFIILIYLYQEFKVIYEYKDKYIAYSPTASSSSSSSSNINTRNTIIVFAPISSSTITTNTSANAGDDYSSKNDTRTTNGIEKLTTTITITIDENENENDTAAIMTTKKKKNTSNDTNTNINNEISQQQDLSLFPSITSARTIGTNINSTATAITATATTATATTATAITATAINTTVINATAINATAINATAINATAINATATGEKEKKRKLFYVIHIGPSKTGTSAIQDDSYRDPNFKDAFEKDHVQYVGRKNPQVVSTILQQLQTNNNTRRSQQLAVAAAAEKRRRMYQQGSRCMKTIFHKNWKNISFPINVNDSRREEMKRTLQNECWNKKQSIQFIENYSIIDSDEGYSYTGDKNADLTVRANLLELLGRWLSSLC